MFTIEQIKELTFDITRKGYNTEDVNDFLGEIADQIESTEKSKEELEKKVYLLATKVAEYRSEEDNLKTVLLNAQRLGEQVISDAKKLADKIIKDATYESNKTINDATYEADKILNSAKSESENIKETSLAAISLETNEYKRIKTEASNFKKDILQLYKNHLSSLSLLPETVPVEPVTPKTLDTLEDDVTVANN